MSSLTLQECSLTDGSIDFLKEFKELEDLRFNDCKDLVVPELKELVSICSIKFDLCFLKASVLMKLHCIPDTCEVILSDTYIYGQKSEELQNWWEICDALDLDDYALKFVCQDIDGYFNWLTNYVLGVVNARILLQRAHQRAVARIFHPGGDAYRTQKRIWDDLK